MTCWASKHYSTLHYISKGQRIEDGDVFMLLTMSRISNSDHLVNVDIDEPDRDDQNVNLEKGNCLKLNHRS